ncbi:MAG: VTT domain-containing protein [Planctomycetota bacterium]|nr:VTT domain-containing protein [Planctomycetota bacterium]
MTQEPGSTDKTSPTPSEPGALELMSQPKQAMGKGIVFVATQLGATSVLAIIASFMPAIAGIYLLANIGPVSEWFKGHGDAGLVVYIAAFALLSGLALLPTYAQAVLGGYAFGMLAGVPAALCGFLGGSIIAYEIGRASSRDRIEGLLSKSPKWRAVRDALVGSKKEDDLLKSIGTVTLLRLPPNSPFALMNLLLSAIGVPRLAYVIGTCIGMTPRTAAAVAIGAGIQQALTKEAIDQAMPKWMWYAGAAVSIAIVFIIGSIANKAIERVAASGNGVIRRTFR